MAYKIDNSLCKLTNVDSGSQPTVLCVLSCICVTPVQTLEWTKYTNIEILKNIWSILSTANKKYEKIYEKSLYIFFGLVKNNADDDEVMIICPNIYIYCFVSFQIKQ